MQGAPKTHRTQVFLGRQSLVGKVIANFGVTEVDVRENDEATVGLLQYLGSPARFGTRIKPFTADETGLF